MAAAITLNEPQYSVNQIPVDPNKMVEFPVNFRSARTDGFQQKVVGKGSNTLSSKTIADAGQLIRIHVVSARKLSPISSKSTLNPFCQIKVGKATAHTRVINKTQDPVFNEQFVIEYTDDLGDSFVQIKVLHKGRRKRIIGEWREQISNLEQNPFRESKELEIKNNNKVVGWLVVRIRKEIKCTGKLNIQIRGAELFVHVSNDTKLRCILRFGGEKRITPFAIPKEAPNGVVVDWNFQTTFQVTNNNNVRDVFIECWNGNERLGELRLTIHDAKQIFDGRDEILANKNHVPKDEDVNLLSLTDITIFNEPQRNVIGYLGLYATVDED